MGSRIQENSGINFSKEEERPLPWEEPQISRVGWKWVRPVCRGRRVHVLQIRIQMPPPPPSSLNLLPARLVLPAPLSISGLSTLQTFICMHILFSSLDFDPFGGRRNLASPTTHITHSKHAFSVGLLDDYIVCAWGRTGAWTREQANLSWERLVPETPGESSSPDP